MILAIYKKSLVLSVATKQGATTGEVVNLMSVDAHRFTQILPYFHQLWSSPIQFIGPFSSFSSLNKEQDNFQLISFFSFDPFIPERNFCLVAVIVLYHLLGWPVLAGLGTLFIFVPLNVWLVHQSERFMEQLMTIKDQRIRLLNEILQVRAPSFFFSQHYLTIKLSHYHIQSNRTVFSFV